MNPAKAKKQQQHNEEYKMSEWPKCTWKRLNCSFNSTSSNIATFDCCKSLQTLFWFLTHPSGKSPEWKIFNCEVIGQTSFLSHSKWTNGLSACRGSTAHPMATFNKTLSQNVFTTEGKAVVLFLTLQMNHCIDHAHFFAGDGHSTIDHFNSHTGRVRNAFWKPFRSELSTMDVQNFRDEIWATCVLCKLSKRWWLW